MSTDRETGVVRWFDGDQGIGLVEWSGGPDVYVHFSAIQGESFGTLDDGQEVEFRVLESPRGPLARDVVVVADSGNSVEPASRRSPADRGPPATVGGLQSMLDKHHQFVETRERMGRQLDLWGADLRGVHLRGADLRGAVLEGADLEGADLAGADLSRSFVFRASFRGADLSDANLRRLLACEADFSQAKLEGANASRANLYGAQFLGANLLRAIVDDSDLSCADLTGATGLSRYRLARARSLHRARLRLDLAQRLEREHPALFSRPARGDAVESEG